MYSRSRAELEGAQLGQVRSRSPRTHRAVGWAGLGSAGLEAALTRACVCDWAVCVCVCAIFRRRVNSRIDPSDVGLTNEGPESMVSSLGGLLKGFILDESPRHTDEERQQAALIQALSRCAPPHSPRWFRVSGG